MADSSTPSVRNWRTMRPRPAPSAIRTAISGRRTEPRASRRPATLVHAISSTSNTAASEREQRRPRPSEQRVVQRHDAHAPSLRVPEIAPASCALTAVEVGLRLLNGHARLSDGPSP